ncbi:DUF4956 domain-containing protein (plasmid) [Deinococcus taeanensis]|uniref:DUF4956 domain-containing protein n=1 Tax=Deinococcus taeanensis TaxID=2737050 RepID=UPI001CDBD16B|nr:DUF4956 domain-containing protein [Deinococcus taeanensis]UBV44849.1 DUF4956 domain-containing protein [Deinococcus taeanensis]
MLTGLHLDVAGRLLLNTIAVLTIVRWLYYPAQRDRELAFSLFVFGLTTFLVASVLMNLELPAGLGFGLFAVFSLLRYRTEGISNKALTYLFVVATLAILNALGNFTPLVFILLNALVVLATAAAEDGRLLGVQRRRQEVRQTVQYERIDLIRPDRRADLLADLEARTGWQIVRLDIGEVDFLKDVVTLRVTHVPPEAQPPGVTGTGKPDSAP